MVIFVVWMGWFLPILSNTCCLKPFIQFLLKRIYSLEEVGWRIPRWLLRVWLSLVCEWDWLAILSLNIARSLPSSFWTREYMVWKRIMVEEFQDAWIVHGNLWWVNGVILAISESHIAGSIPSIFWSREYMDDRRCWLKNSKMAV